MLYAGAAAVDSAMTTIWMAVTVVVPRLLGRLVRRGVAKAQPKDAHSTLGLVGALGNAIGTYLGFLIGHALVTAVSHVDRARLSLTPPPPGPPCRA